MLPQRRVVYADKEQRRINRTQQTTSILNCMSEKDLQPQTPQQAQGHVDDESTPGKPSGLPQVPTVNQTVQQDGDSLEDLDRMVAQQAEQQIGDLAAGSDQQQDEQSVSLEQVPASDADHLDLQIDESTHQLTEAEIQEILSVQGLSGQPDQSTSPGSPAPQKLQLKPPAPVEWVLWTLDLLDKPFRWVPMPVKRVAGYLAVASTVAAGAVTLAWILGVGG